MSFKSIIEVENISKCYEIYKKPLDRLKQYATQGVGAISQSSKKNIIVSSGH